MLRYSLLLLAPLGQLSAALVTFDGLTPDAPLTTPNSGWTFTGAANPASAPFAFVGSFGGSLAGALGGEFADGVGDSMKLNYGSTLLLPTVSVGFDMLIADSTSTVPARDTFGFHVADGSGVNVVQLQFIPLVQSLAAPAEWVLSYKVAGGNFVNTGVSLNGDSEYFLDLLFDGGQLTLTVGNSVGSLSFGSAITGFNAGTNGIGDVSFVWEKTSPNAAYGDNTMYFDNLSIGAVPEPSALLLSALGSFFLMKRNRRV